MAVKKNYIKLTYLKTPITFQHVGQHFQESTNRDFKNLNLEKYSTITWSNFI